ncbi:hypothetical protein ECANGB1_2657 [Enterospora canceri]|uniref:Secreted protein n=1 Tax=Enterospora canceri TaxID=1081671 RepID=A0A1Y1S6E7_9MICR|nr:hypothetical protein ECANGB1_2657 [Enterospora canceri]
MYGLWSLLLSSFFFLVSFNISSGEMNIPLCFLPTVSGSSKFGGFKSSCPIPFVSFFLNRNLLLVVSPFIGLNVKLDVSSLFDTVIEPSLFFFTLYFLPMYSRNSSSISTVKNIQVCLI